MIGSPEIRKELKRKAFHALSALYAVLYTLAGRRASLWTLGPLLAVVATLEAVRLRAPSLNETLIRVFGGIHREAEVRRPSGILWTLLGCFLTLWLVPFPDVALASLWYLALGDGLAGLVGKKWGHIRIGSKSLEGSLTCFLTCWFIGTLCLQSPFGSTEVLFGALTATLVELIPMPLNDNLWIPLLSGLVITALRVMSGF